MRQQESDWNQPERDTFVQHVEKTKNKCSDKAFHTIYGNYLDNIQRIKTCAFTKKTLQKFVFLHVRKGHMSKLYPHIN